MSMKSYEIYNNFKEGNITKKTSLDYLISYVEESQNQKIRLDVIGMTYNFFV